MNGFIFPWRLMNRSKLAKVLHLCDLIALKSSAIQEKLSCQQLEESEIDLLVALYCRELTILNRQIESIIEVHK